MKRSRALRRLTSAAALWLALAGPMPATGQEPPPNGDEERIVQALELMRRMSALESALEELLAELPAGLREEVERRWREEQAPSSPVPSAAEDAEPAPLPAPAPKTVRPAAEDRAPEAPSEPGVEPPPRRPPERVEAEPAPAESPCGSLEILDSNGDGVVSGTDRYWRYLALWKDDGDGELEPREVRSLYDHGIRRVSARLYSYTTAKDADRTIWVEDLIYFELPGRRARGALVIDAGRLERGGELRLEERSGAPLAGFQALRSAVDWVFEDGRRQAVLCR